MPAVNDEPQLYGTLRIDSPIHGRIELPLACGSISVGRDLASDLVLADSTIAGLHFKLHVGAKVSLEAFSPIILVPDGDMLPGQLRVLDADTAFKAGNVPVHIQLATHPMLQPSQPASGRSRLRYKLAAAAMVLVCIGSATLAFAGRDAARDQPVPAPKQAQQVSMPAPLARAAIQSQLDERQLGSVRIEELTDGSYRATGTVTPHEAPSWRAVAQWLDATQGGRVILVDKVVVASPGPQLSVQAAWIGERPYVIDGSGQKLFIGAVLADGWAIEGIEAGRVTLKRQGRSMAVRF